MMMRTSHAFLFLALGACAVDGAGDDDATSETAAEIHTTGTAIPEDGACAHIVATRLSDFHVAEYRGVLADATFTAPLGEHRVTAVAYPEPCTAEPAAPPWRADDQIIDLVRGANTLVLRFHADTTVDVDPEFDGAEPLVVRAGTRTRIGRNGEDAAGPDYSLDGWEVKRITVPPAGGGGTASETTLFSLEGVGGANALPYSPRGLAVLPDGRFVAQVAEPGQPLRVYTSAGAYEASWAVTPGAAIQWNWTDGLDVVDATHLVRTGWLNTPIHCDADGNGCVQAGLDILQIVTTAGVTHLEVTQQIALPAPFSAEYALGVAYVGGRYAVTTLPASGSNLLLLNGDGTIAAGPTAVDGSLEGLFVAADGRLGALEYEGRLRMFDAATTALRAGEELSYPVGAGVSNPTSLAWSDASGGYLALVGSRVVSAPASFASATTLPIDLNAFAAPTSIDHVPDSNELLVADRVPPADPTTGARVPAIDVFSLATSAFARRVTLQDVSLPARTRTLAYIPARHQVATHYRRPGATVDPTIDARVFVHSLDDGSLTYSFDVAPFGFPRVLAVNYLRGTDELLLTVSDQAGTVRLLVTDAAGRPRRSYRTDGLAGIADLAPISSGAAAGDVAVMLGQPSEVLRVFLP